MSLKWRHRAEAESERQALKNSKSQKRILGNLKGRVDVKPAP